MFNKTFQYILKNYIYTLMFISTFIYILAYYTFSQRNFLLILNGVYVGQIVAIVVTFGPYFAHVLFTHDPYTRARQYAITTGMQHLAYLLVVTYSVTARRYGSTIIIDNIDWQLLASRYLILLVGFLQLTAPDFGKPIMYGLSRKALWIGSAAGFVVACVTIWLQFWPYAVVPVLMNDLLGLGN